MYRIHKREITRTALSTGVWRYLSPQEIAEDLGALQVPRYVSLVDRRLKFERRENS